ncbi:YfjI family protein [Nonomuraea candida]|uniref:YfjI family protein n=1 Tax=Nonomuraea candida TaxID=359159 RepID=UPI00069473A2|nr:YfjI family protein [Nonomuraea candida]
MTAPLEADAILNDLDAPASIAHLHQHLRAVTSGEDPRAWEDPIPVDAMASLPEFPTEVFPEPIAAMVLGVAAEMQVPSDMPGCLVLAALATGAGGRAEVHVRGQWREPLNLYTAVAAAPGMGKSPVFNAVMAPVFAAESRLQDRVRPKIKELEAEQRRAKARAEAARRRSKSPEEEEAAADALQLAEEIEIPILPRLYVDDITPETGTTVLAEQGGRMAVLSSEGAFLENIMGRYSSGKPNLELALKGHAGDRLRVDRRARAESVERPALTVGVCIQPQMLEDLSGSKQMHGRGALARVLFCLPPDLVGHRNVRHEANLDEDVLRTYMDLMTNLIVDLADVDEMVTIELSPEAVEAHLRFREEIEPRLRRGTGDLESLREWASKLGGHTIRLAGLLHLAEHTMDGLQKPISADTMRKAIRLARYFTDHAMAAFGIMRANPLLDPARAVLAWIRKASHTEVTVRQVQRGFQKRFGTSEDVARVLSLLEEYGYLRFIEAASTGGRKSLRYAVNPQIFGDTVTEAS